MAPKSGISVSFEQVHRGRHTKPDPGAIDESIWTFPKMGSVAPWPTSYPRWTETSAKQYSAPPPPLNHLLVQPFARYLGSRSPRSP